MNQRDKNLLASEGSKRYWQQRKRFIETGVSEAKEALEEKRAKRRAYSLARRAANPHHGRDRYREQVTSNMTATQKTIRLALLQIRSWCRSNGYTYALNPRHRSDAER